MNCHYIDMQLERIRDAGIGAGAGFSSEGSSELEEQLHRGGGVTVERSRASTCRYARKRDIEPRKPVGPPRMRGQ
jgi:hypothetical protein